MAGMRSDVVRGSDLGDRIEAIDRSLEVMDQFPGKMASAEMEVNKSLMQRDREYKDSHFHSITRSRKHQM